MYTEVGLGLVAGVSGTALLFGLDPKLLALSVAVSSNPATSLIASATVSRQLALSAKGALLMGGLNAGLQSGAGGAIYIGYLF